MAAQGIVTVARIVGVHGLAGGVKVQVFADSDLFFQPGAAIDLRRTDGRQQRLTIKAWTGRGKLLFFETIADRDQAQSLVGCDLVVDRQALPPTDEDEYYWHDLIGLRVIDGRIGDIGTIVSIIPTGGNDVYLVKGPRGETLVPAIGSVVVAVDLAGATMRVNLPEGL